MNAQAKGKVMVPLFTYGSLKKGGKNHRFLEGLESHPAQVDGYSMHEGPGYPYVHAGEGSIYGEIYQISEELLSKLDLIQGYPQYFDRDWVLVKPQGQEPLRAWMYVYDKAGQFPRIASGNWVGAQPSPNKAEENSSLRLFAYGSLKKGGKNHRHLSQLSSTPAHLVGYSMHRGPGYPYVNRGDSVVYGELYEVSPEQLLEIDHIQGYPQYMDRHHVQVNLDEGKKAKAWVYVHEEAANYPLIQSGKWSAE